MPRNKIEDLRNLLFETMERLMDPDDPMDVKTAAAMGDVAQVLVNSAKVEVDLVKLTGRGGSDFIQGDAPRAPLQIVSGPQTPIVITPDARHEDLCQQCTLPDCNDMSPMCLVQIQKRAV